MDVENKTKRQEFVEVLVYEYRSLVPNGYSIAELDKLRDLLSAGKADWFLKKLMVNKVIDDFLDAVESILFEDQEMIGFGHSKREMPYALNDLCDYAVDIELDRFTDHDKAMADWKQIEIAIRWDGLMILHYLTAEESINNAVVMP